MNGQYTPGTISAQVFLATIMEAANLKDGHALNLLGDIADAVGEGSELEVPKSEEGELRASLREIRIRLAGQRVMEALRNEEDFSPQDISQRLQALYALSDYEVATVATALAYAR